VHQQLAEIVERLRAGQTPAPSAICAYWSSPCLALGPHGDVRPSYPPRRPRFVLMPSGAGVENLWNRSSGHSSYNGLFTRKLALWQRSPICRRSGRMLLVNLAGA
jgi:hypothetical protein